MEDQPVKISEFSLKVVHLLWLLGGGIAVLVFKSFDAGSYVQKTYVTTTDLRMSMESNQAMMKTAIDGFQSELAKERAYEREQHENLSRELHAYSNDNHTDAVAKVAALSTEQKVMGVKMDQLIDTVKEIRDRQPSSKKR